MATTFPTVNPGDPISSDAWNQIVQYLNAVEQRLEKLETPLVQPTDPVQRITGISPELATQLAAVGIKTATDLANTDAATLQTKLNFNAVEANRIKTVSNAALHIG